MKASSLCFRMAVLMALAGMTWGIVMASTNDHSAMPAHAHLNLLGWVSLFLFGVFYHLHPGLDRSRLALAQAGVWAVGVVGMTVGVGLIHTGHEQGEPVAAVTSMVLLADMLVFGWLVLRGEPQLSKKIPAV